MREIITAAHDGNAKECHTGGCSPVRIERGIWTEHRKHSCKRKFVFPSITLLSLLHQSQLSLSQKYSSPLAWVEMDRAWDRGRLGTNCQSWLGLHLQLLEQAAEQAAVIVVRLP